jgi:hypothetical protein
MSPCLQSRRLAAGLLFRRVFCEGMIVVFGIHERLGQIRDGFAQR